MPLFKKIRYGRVLFEALRGYFAVNTKRDLSLLYKYCAALIFPLQGPFDAYDVVRRMYEVIATCNWVIGQLTNVLNYLFDPILNRIFINQATTFTLSAPEFEYDTDVQMNEFDEDPVQTREFNDRAAGSLVKINVPIGTDIAALTATIEQIKPDGIDYTIIEF